jgi:hypothetical protein
MCAQEQYNKREDSHSHITNNSTQDCRWLKREFEQRQGIGSAYGNTKRLDI